MRHSPTTFAKPDASASAAPAAATHALTRKGDFLALERGCPVRVNGQDAWFDGFTHSPCGGGAIWVYAQRPLRDGSPGVLDGSEASPAWHQVDYSRATVEHAVPPGNRASA